MSEKNGCCRNDFLFTSSIEYDSIPKQEMWMNSFVEWVYLSGIVMLSLVSFLFVMSRFWKMKASAIMNNKCLRCAYYFDAMIQTLKFYLYEQLSYNAVIVFNEDNMKNDPKHNKFVQIHVCKNVFQQEISKTTNLTFW